LADDAGSARFFKNDGKLWFDLPGYVRHRLARAGVSGVTDDGVDIPVLSQEWGIS
jgi:copper oxidase (laccase) domain-containing protein